MGSGPAGLTAAIYTSRASLSTIVIEGRQPGGQLTTTTEVENYPGFVKTIDGSGLVNDMREQAKRFGTECSSDIVLGIHKENNSFMIECDSGKKYESRVVIIASGAVARSLPGLNTKEIRWFWSFKMCNMRWFFLS